MNDNKLIKKIARLESINDQLISELQYLDTITRELGFQDGLQTLKEAAQELLQEQHNEEFNKDDDHLPPKAGWQKNRDKLVINIKKPPILMIGWIMPFMLNF